MEYTLTTDDGAIVLHYHEKMVLITNVEKDGYDYLDSLLYSIAGTIISPKLILIPNCERYIGIIRENGFRTSNVVLDRKWELYYLGDRFLIPNLLYDYYLERDKIEPFNNIKFLRTINSAHKTLSYRMDTVIAI